MEGDGFGARRESKRDCGIMVSALGAQVSELRRPTKGEREKSLRYSSRYAHSLIHNRSALDLCMANMLAEADDSGFPWCG